MNPLAITLSSFLAPGLALGLAPRLAPGQVAQEARRCTVAGASPSLARLLAAAAAALPRAPARAGRPLAMHVLGCLRLGDTAASARAIAAGVDDLAAPREAAASDDVAWLAAAALWHARASGDPPPPPVPWGQLVAAVERATATPPGPTFAAAAMQAHALFCLGALAGRAEDRWTATAIDRLLALERQAWQPGRGHFRTVLAQGELVPATAPGAATLLPASAGLLLATGDRMHRHLTQVLAHFDQDPGEAVAADVEAAALCLIAATQLHEDAGRARAFRRLLAATAGRVEAEHAGLVLDALVFAVTGVRIATGAGLDEAWQRCAPWLPPDHERLEVRSLLAGGARYDVMLESRLGPRASDEADGTAHLAGDAPRLHVRLRLHGSAGAARTLVVAGQGAQTVHWLQPGETFACSLPREQPQAQHDAHPLDRGTATTDR